jgi:hypothetical protein
MSAIVITVRSKRCISPKFCSAQQVQIELYALALPNLRATSFKRPYLKRPDLDYPRA